MTNLTEIESFGGIDADTDDLLDSCFQDHKAYREALSHDSYVIVGRKGSGKTAIYKKINRTHSHDVFSYGHTFADYPWHHHAMQDSVGVPTEQRYVHSWRYLILLTAAKILLNHDQSQPWKPSVRRYYEQLEAFVTDSYGSRNPNVTEIFAPNKRLRVSPHLQVTEAVQLGVDLEKLPVSDLPKVFQEVNHTVEEAVVECINDDLNYYICFDELDRGFEPSDEEYSQMLIGLILAAKRINRRANRLGKSFSVIIFLRDDIYQTLRFEDKNKITEGAVERIEWDTRRTDWTLKQLMEKRFGTAIADQESLDWEEVFDESQEMPGRQTKYQHILDRTFHRPRDIIKFCNEVLYSYKRRGGDEQDKFANEDVIDARSRYSEYLLRELDDEIHKHLPEYEQYLDILKAVGALQFSKDEFADACARRSDLIPDDMTPIDVLRSLFEFSVVAYQRTGGVGGGSRYKWRFKDPRVRFDEAATNFRVHPGFREALGLKKFTKSS